MGRTACRTKSGSTHMVVGDPNIFAIESGIMQAYEYLGLRALGFFVIHVDGRSFGLKEPDATHLANSFDEVGRRIAGRGAHSPIFAMDSDAHEIALAFRRCFYAECEDGEIFLGMTKPMFSKAINGNHLVWAPDGDAAFDDGGYVLHFEDENRVRIIAFKSTEDNLYDPASLRDLWLPADDFYAVLREWRDKFEAQWEVLPKEPAHVTVFPAR